MFLSDPLRHQPISSSPSTIRIVPHLSTAALQHGLDKELALWYCLRAINYWGSGRLDLEYSVKALTDWFGYSRSTAYRILNAGDGVFWDKRPLQKINRLQIQIYGLQKVARYFGIRCGRYFLEISHQDFVGGGSNRVSLQRAWLYASFHKPQGTKALPISRAAIQVATGVNRRSQQRYDRIAVRRVPNFVNQYDFKGKLIPILGFVQGKSQEWLVHKRLGNTYHCRANRGATGMLRKLNTALKQSLEKGEACFSKRFFITARGFIRCKRRAPDPLILVRPTDRLVPGRVEWCGA